ncbi:4-fold beta flower protein [Paenibacillus sp. FSL H7-0941]|uniref:4-fold beta flower protein n=1 Tax=unclassified Paenibacillus TaxID=185978 RepID=UPI0030FBFEB9
MDYAIWAISGRFCGKVYDDQVYDANGRHVGHISDSKIYSASTGRVVGEFYREDRVGIKSNKSYSIKGVRATRATRGFAQRANKAGISPAGWVDPTF